jgi:hypothetical protein
MVQTIPESHFPQDVGSPVTACFRIDAGVNEGQLHIPQAVSARKKIEGLKNKTDLAIPNHRQLIVRHAGNVASIEFVTPGAGRIESAEHVHKCRFAAATGAHDRQIFVAKNLQRHATERVNNFFSHHVVFRDVLDVNDYRLR